MGHLNYTDFVDLVVGRDVRPERPQKGEAPNLSEQVWQLAEQCWVKDPSLRPTANAVCDAISLLLDMDGGFLELQSSLLQDPHSGTDDFRLDIREVESPPGLTIAEAIDPTHPLKGQMFAFAIPAIW